MADDERPTSGQTARENMLAIMLTAVVLGVFGVFMIVVTGGLLLQLLGVVIAGSAIGWIHYRLWGRTLVEKTAGEREEAELRDKLEGEEWDKGPFGPKND
jgi:hypothetical protein